MFVGREKELNVLSDLWETRSSSLVVCSGRRRVGKSTLVEEFARRSGCRFVEIVGPKLGLMLFIRCRFVPSSRS